MESKETEIVNGVITSTSLGPVENGMFTIYITIEMNGSGVTVGGMRLDTYDKELKACVGTAYGLNVIMETLNVIGVSRWEDLVGKYVRVETHGIGEYVSKIGNIMKDKWIDYSTYKVGIEDKE